MRHFVCEDRYVLIVQVKNNIRKEAEPEVKCRITSRSAMCFGGSMSRRSCLLRGGRLWFHPGAAATPGSIIIIMLLPLPSAQGTKASASLTCSGDAKSREVEESLSMTTGSCSESSWSK